MRRRATDESNDPLNVVLTVQGGSIARDGRKMGPG